MLINKKLHTPEHNVKQNNFTTDIWSTYVAYGFLLGLMAHWLSDNFEKSSAVLHVTALEESHSGSHLCAYDMLSAWKISKVNVHVIFRDNAANKMVRAIGFFGCNW